MHHLFKQCNKKGKGAGTTFWKHRFVCLSHTNQTRIPTTDFHKDELLQAGLGEKVVEFDDIDMDTSTYRDTILDAYPKLKDGGGFINVA